MEAYKELIDFLKSEKRAIKFRKNSTIHKLFVGIDNGKIKEIQDVFSLCGGNEKAAYELCYQLKNNLIQALVNHSATAKFKSNFHKKIDNIYNLLNASNRLRGGGAWLSAVETAKTGLKQSIKINHTESSLNFSRILYSYYSSIHLDIKKSKYYYDLVETFNNRMYWEVKTELDYKDIQKYLGMEQAISPQRMDQLKNSIKEIQKHLYKIDSHRFHQFSFNLICTYYQLQYQHDAIIKEATKAIQYFEGQNLVPYSMKTDFYFKMVNSYIQIGAYELADNVLNGAFEIIPIDTINYHVALQYQSILCFHSGDYNKALSIIKNLNKNKSAYKNMVEMWLIIEAFVYLLVKIGWISSQRHFRLGKFLNEVPIFSRDKTGINITIIVIQVMFLLINKKQDEIADKIEALNMYVYRHMRAEHTKRSKIFLKMVGLLPKGNFIRHRVEVLTSEHFIKLKKVKYKDLEFFPYEVLWGIILDLLD